MGTQLPYGKGQSSLPHFRGLRMQASLRPCKPAFVNRGPCLFWPNGWMDQDITWYGGRPRPRRHRVRWDLATPVERGIAAPHFSAHVYIVAKRLDGSRYHLLWGVGLSSGDTVLDGDPAPPPERGIRVSLCGFCHIYTSGLGVGAISGFAETGSSF